MSNSDFDGHILAKLGKHFLDVRMRIVGANCAFRLDILNVQQAEDKEAQERLLG